MPLGIPHSIFLGRVPKPGEPYWLDDDQDKALAFVAERAKVCPDCATRPEEWAEDEYAYVADTYVCPGCEVLDMEREQLREGARRGEKPFLRRRRPDEE